MAKAIHNTIGDFYFTEPDFDEAGGRTYRHVKVPKETVRDIVAAALAASSAEYICTCGLRVEPHRCPSAKGDF